MSHIARDWAKRQRTGSSTRKAVLLAIADHADKAGVCWPSQKTIMEETELSQRSVRNALAELEKAGLITREKRSRPDGSRSSDRLVLALDHPPARGAGGGAADAGGVGHHVPGGGARAAGLTLFEPSSEPSDNDAVGAMVRDPAALKILEARLREAAGPALNPMSAGLFSMAEPLRWLDQGADLDLDVVPALRATAARPRGSPVSSWAYFANAVADARHRRLNSPATVTTLRSRHERPNPIMQAFDELDADIAAACCRTGGPGKG